MSKQKTKVKKQDKPSADKIGYEDLAVLLTILDKEAHNAKYFEPMRKIDDVVDTSYIDKIRRIQFVHAAQVKPEKVDEFLENNTHLNHLFNL